MDGKAESVKKVSQTDEETVRSKEDEILSNTFKQDKARHEETTLSQEIITITIDEAVCVEEEQAQDENKLEEIKSEGEQTAENTDDDDDDDDSTIIIIEDSLEDSLEEVKCCRCQTPSPLVWVLLICGFPIAWNIMATLFYKYL